MATIQGIFVDDNTGKSLPGVVMDVYPTGDQSGTPITSFQSNDDGSFNLTSSYFDTPGSSIDVNYPGYYELSGTPTFFNGHVSLVPTSIVKTLQSVPIWVWILLIAIILFFGYHHFYKGKKLF